MKLSKVEKREKIRSDQTFSYVLELNSIVIQFQQNSSSNIKNFFF